MTNEELAAKIEELSAKIDGLSALTVSSGDEVSMSAFVRSDARDFVGRETGEVDPFEGVKRACQNTNFDGDVVIANEDKGVEAQLLDDAWAAVAAIKAGTPEMRKRFAGVWPSFAAYGVLSGIFSAHGGTFGEAPGEAALVGQGIISIADYQRFMLTAGDPSGGNV